MAENNKLKIIYLLEMMRKTDEHHPLNTPQIIEKLNEYGISAERKAIGRDIQALQEAGFDIVLCEDRKEGWYMLGQSFEDYELKLLADAVAQAQFLTMKDSRELIRKIKDLATKGGEDIIDSTIVMDETLKQKDTGFTRRFDTIMRAITGKKQITFRYLKEVAGNKKEYRREGAIYQLSPYYLGIWGHEYFVVGNTQGHDNASPYRVDMMTDISITDIPVRPMAEIDELKGIGKKGRTFGDYIKECVNLWGGETFSVKLCGVNSVRKEIVKRFGNNLMFIDRPDEQFSVNINTTADGWGFYQWLARFGDNIWIEGPDWCIEKYKGYLKQTLKMYEDK